MDPLERQTKLQHKLAALRQRSQLQAAQNLLLELGIPEATCTIVLPDNPVAKQSEQWLTQAFPWLWGQIDWANVPDSICWTWGTREAAALALNQLQEIYQLGNPRVHVVWFSADAPMLQLPLAAVQQSAPAILAQDWDTWVIEPGAGWCIECHHEGTLGYGKGRSANFFSQNNALPI